MKLPPITPQEIKQEMEVQKALDKLPYGKLNPKAKEIAAGIRAKHVQK